MTKEMGKGREEVGRKKAQKLPCDASEMWVGAGEKVEQRMKKKNRNSGEVPSRHTSIFLPKHLHREKETKKEVTVVFFFLKTNALILRQKARKQLTTKLAEEVEEGTISGISSYFSPSPSPLRAPIVANVPLIPHLAIFLVAAVTTRRKKKNRMAATTEMLMG